MLEEDRSGRAFLAYQGTEYTFDEIISHLNRRKGSYFTVKANKHYSQNVIFAKVVCNSYEEYRDPFYNNAVITVSGYIQDEMIGANQTYSSYCIDNVDKKHQLINYLYNDFGNNVFSKLNNIHFSSVIYDTSLNTIIAGVTKASKKYTNLFYGYTRQNHEIMFSNLREVLTKFCDEIEEMDSNTYMVVCNNECDFYNLDGTKVDKKNPTLIKKDKKIADNLIDGLNDLLLQVASEGVKEKIKINIDEYLNSEDSKKTIIDYVSKKLDIETQKQIMTSIKQSIEKIDIENQIYSQFNELINKKLEEYTKKTNIPTVYIVKLNDTVLGQTSGGFYHEKFEQILSLVHLDEPVMLIGPAGSGKNVSVSQVAQALGLKMYYTNNASNEFKLTGFIDAGGNYRDTEFYKAFKNGGLFFLDEIDNSDPSALIVINSALANGYMAFPHETIDRHPNFRIVSAANTWGKGSDLQYVGRQALDAATLDRFDNIFFDYDTKLEQALYPNDEVLQFMWAFRNAVYQTKIPHIVSTRGIGKVYKKEINGIPIEHILTSNVIKNLSQDDINIIIGNMQNVSSNNKYFDGIKRLRLNR